jgi:hypothetical protein
MNPAGANRNERSSYSPAWFSGSLNGCNYTVTVEDQELQILLDQNQTMQLLEVLTQAGCQAQYIDLGTRTITVLRRTTAISMRN